MMTTPLCKSSILDVYKKVMEDVISSVREVFHDDGVDEQVLQELKQSWEAKLTASKAVPTEPEPVPKKVVVQPQTTVVKQIVQTRKLVPIQLSLPVTGSNEPPRQLTLQVPASALQNNQLQKVLTGPIISATMNLPPAIASSVLQQHVNAAFAQATVVTKTQTDGACDLSDEETELTKRIMQMDGNNFTSDEEEEESDDDDDDDDDALNDNLDIDEEEDVGVEDDPLNSEDDVTDDEAPDLFNTDNVVVCQYDKISRSRNKWKFLLKDGIMNLNGQDYIFQKASGEAEW